MSKIDALFVGGPVDGRRASLNGDITRIAVDTINRPEFPMVASWIGEPPRSPAVAAYSTVFYVREAIKVGSNTYFFFVPSGTTPDQAIQMLIDGYRRVS